MRKVGSVLLPKSTNVFYKLPLRTLKRRSDFLEMRDSRCFVKSATIMVQAAVFLAPPSVGPFALVGYTASKKVGGAVIRNLTKRRLRAIVQESLSALVLPYLPPETDSSTQVERWRVSNIQFSKRTMHDVHASLAKLDGKPYSSTSEFNNAEKYSDRKANYGFAFVFIATSQTASVPWVTLQSDVKMAIASALSRMRVKNA